MAQNSSTQSQQTPLCPKKQTSFFQGVWLEDADHCSPLTCLFCGKVCANILNTDRLISKAVMVFERRL